MKQTTKIILCFLSLLYWSCNNSTQTKSREKTFNFADKYISVKRTVYETGVDEYKVVMQIKSPEQLEGYVTLDDSFANPIQIIDSTKWKYAPYFSSDKEIRFVFSDPAKTQGQATPIPNFNLFIVDYKIKTKDGKKLKINGTVMYLVKYHQYLTPVPELVTSIDY